MKKQVIVSGASSGIGKATVEIFAQSGHNVLALARRKDRLVELEARFPGLVKGLALDVTSNLLETELNFALKQMLAQSPTPQSPLVLVNCAGLARGMTEFNQSDLRDVDAMLETNLRALLRVTHLVLPNMLEAMQGGDIVNIGSVAGRWVYPGGAVYCATKHAVRAFSEGLRMDLHGKNIRVINIEPGMVETEFSEVRLGSVEKAKAVYQGMHPLTAEDIAECIFWTVMRPRHINIQELVIYPSDQAHVTMVNRR